MRVEAFLDKLGSDFFSGVPDSQLKALCNYLISRYGIDEKHHIIAANEGNAVGIAAGYHLATHKIPVVYMQNSGEGNIINPVASLLNEKVYGIPCIFIIGWRGEPGGHDEPQHIFQGEVTCKLLDDMDIPFMVLNKDTTESDVAKKMIEFSGYLAEGKQVGFVVRKSALEFDGKVDYSNANSMSREEIIRHIVAVTQTDPIVSTTGKASRELFEIREANKQGHAFDFLTVGSMGHSSSIALGIAAQKPQSKVWIIDGDGAALMHMGSMALLGSSKLKNIVHIIINNGAHETVGGQPTVMQNVDVCMIAEGCGYSNIIRVSTPDELDNALKKAKNSNELFFIEAKCAIGARDNLGRPTTSARENKEGFMKYLEQLR